MGKMVIPLAVTIILLFLACVVGAALLPLMPAAVNPPVVTEPQWASPQTRALAQRACFDCHSNETVWPWYSRTLAASWLLQRDVAEGREHLNFSDWSAEEGRDHLEHIREVITQKEMPPFQYLLLHPEARLTAAEREELASGLENTLR